ncbi:hypothetical protein SAMN05216188_10962 [Lentzea xinjiangensis]|uniref:Uncharacterized protein n=1 Tax=Lentzea xinjiangensis TaxID=402600 RepID=A0A1H9MH59_9PSEU|nr:hypothetical protein [Lentzea xinjiangensis]SER23050.1 hypothetical protein SAMN05216188_10962 [Lentzea xinjiangensis]
MSDAGQAKLADPVDPAPAAAPPAAPEPAQQPPPSGSPGAGGDAKPQQEPEKTKEEQPNKARGEEEPPDAKRNASDPRNARKLGQDARAVENAVAAMLGERSIGTIFMNSSIGLVDAGVIGQSGAGSYRAVPSGPISAEVIRSVTATFVAPASYVALRERLREQWIVLLRGPAGSGRTATALNLLSSECAEGIDKLNPDTSLRSPSDALALRDDRGYLLESLELDQAASLTEYSLGLWQRQLESARARMIVLVDAGTAMRESELAHYLVDTAQLADGKAVVASHFQVQLKLAGRTDQQLDDHPEFGELVDEVVATTPRAQDLAEFGRGLSQIVLGQRDIEDLRQSYTRTADSGFREWFDGLGDNEQRAFAIALAVFDGMPVQVVSEAATELAKAIQAAEIPDRRARVREVFAVRRLSLVERVHAELTTSVEDSDFGSLTVQVVRYRDRRRPRRVLEHVWCEYPEAHQVVRTWLRDLGSSPDRQVRARAGVAAGLLSLAEFDHVRRHVLEPWADVRHDWERQAVIGALRLPTMQPELQPLINRMVTSWLRGKTATGRRIAAVAILGTLPIVEPARVLKLLRKAADTDEDAMVIAISDSITNLALDPDRLGLVLEALERWTRARPIGVRAVGLTCVLQLCSFLEAGVEGSAEPWPGLLWVAEGEHRDAVVTLLARAMEAPFFMPETYEVIRRWVLIAQRDAAQREPLGALLADASRNPSRRRTLRHNLTRWAEGRRGPVDAVAELVAVLDREDYQP